MQHLVNDGGLDLACVLLPGALEVAPAQVDAPAADGSEGQDAVPPAGRMLGSIEEEEHAQVLLRCGLELLKPIGERHSVSISELGEDSLALDLGEPLDCAVERAYRRVPRVRILDLDLRPCGGALTAAREVLRGQRTREEGSGNKDDDPGWRLVCRHTADGGGAPLGMLEGGPEIFRNSSYIV